MDFTKLCKEVSQSVNDNFSKILKVNGIPFKIIPASAKNDDTLNTLYSEVDESKTDTVAEYNKLKRRTISYSLVAIKGEDLPEVIDQGGKSLDRNTFIYDQSSGWPNAVIDSLFAAIMDLKKRVKTSIEDGIEFDWFEDPELLKEGDDDELLAEAEKLEAEKAERESELDESEDNTVQNKEQFD